MKTPERRKLYGVTLRDIVIRALGGKCARCSSTENLHVHHKDSNLHNSSQENLELLCENCHSLIHGKFFGSNREGEDCIRTNLYLKSEVLTLFKEICYREGKSMSVKVTEFMQTYNQAHAPGNPQLRISVYAKPEEPSPLRVLCDFIHGATSEGLVNCRRKGLWVQGVACYSCDRNQLRKNP